MFDIVPFKRRLSEDDKFSKIVDDFFDKSYGFLGNNIKTDIKEEDDKYILESELPGVDKGDIEIEIEDDVLRIKASRDEEIKKESDNYIRKERRSGSYQRSFKLDNVKKDEIDASYDNGILIVRLPKDEVSVPKKKTIDIE